MVVDNAEVVELRRADGEDVEVVVVKVRLYSVFAFCEQNVKPIDVDVQRKLVCLALSTWAYRVAATFWLFFAVA